MCCVCYLVERLIFDCQPEYNTLTQTQLKAEIKPPEKKERWLKKRKRCIEVLTAKGVGESLSPEDFELEERVEMTDSTGEN